MSKATVHLVDQTRIVKVLTTIVIDFALQFTLQNIGITENFAKKRDLSD